jgi:hypothetical protein
MKDEELKEVQPAISPIGFAGLTSLASTLDAEITTPEKPNEKEEVSLSKVETKSDDVNQSVGTNPTVHEIYQTPKQAPGISKGAKWWIGIGLFAGIVFLSNLFNNESQSTRPTPSVNTRASTATTEQIPPIGTGLSLERDELRYCLSEDIRLEAARQVLNEYSDSQINRFNAMVEDYNSRCSSFRYRSSTLASVKADVELNRSALEAQGRRRFSR